MKKGKKFIAPGTWFSMTYPADWSEFDGGEGSFLFYNPDKWEGNFRISAFRGHSSYGESCVERELSLNPAAQRVRIGELECAYAQEPFVEEGQQYVNHQWVAGIGDEAFEISFAAPEHASIQVARDIIATLEPRYADEKYPAEVIPIRLSEIVQVDEGYDWVQKTVKQKFTRDFKGDPEDLKNMQALVDSGEISPKKREAWLSLGITLCVILMNEVDGLEWCTLVDGNREVPVLRVLADGQIIDPMTLVWSKVKAGLAVDLVATYENML